ncbi:MAG: ribosomal-processing cysteine protease Prp [Ruminococcaceae bacterium]|nr:ribosomal-processing cysteine protease Prp [Oscillospiraceae bacterium]MBE6706610.1 ribosomal-processing cysteine protease Prp [Oscillospiraceae bacterium]
MTKIVFFRSGGSFYGFEENGHSGYADAGEDVLCAAISAMTMLIINTVEVAYASDIEYDIDEGATNIRVRSKAALAEFEEDERKRYAVSGLFMSYYYQLNELVEEYYDHLSVDVKDVDYV